MEIVTFIALREENMQLERRLGLLFDIICFVNYIYCCGLCCSPLWTMNSRVFSPKI